MSGRFLLDTNIVIAFFTGETDLSNKIIMTEEIYIPSIVLGELYYGARKSKQMMKNLEQIDEFIFGNSILSCDTDTANEYGIIKAELAKKGRPIPENDIWIAAIARQYELILITRDEHFKEIDNLKIEVW